MRIAEIFQSIQGEGLLAGTPSVFVRTTGCNLRCRFCDTPYTSWQPEGRQRPLDAILREVDRYGCRHAVITGGEPMLQPEIVRLSEELRRRGMHVTVETAATVDRPVHCDLMSLSPKLSNSTPGVGEDAGVEIGWVHRHERARINAAVIRRLVGDYAYQVKFVIDTPADFGEVDEFLADFPEILQERVLLMAQAVTPEALAEKAGWIIPYCGRKGLHYGPRLHIERFGNERGK